MTQHTLDFPEPRHVASHAPLQRLLQASEDLASALPFPQEASKLNVSLVHMTHTGLSKGLAQFEVFTYRFIQNVPIVSLFVLMEDEHRRQRL